MPRRPSKYTAELLAPIVASSHSIMEVLRRLDLPTNGGNHRLISARVRQYDLETAHFGSRARARIRGGPEAQLRALIAGATSLAQVLVALNLPPEGRPHRELTARARALGIDISHLKGTAWSRGETAATHESVARIARKLAASDDEVFVENSSVVNNGPVLVRRLRAMGCEYRCAFCGISEWQGRPLVLHLDHVNGVRLHCPNCHSQTETYCNRRRTPSSEAREVREPRHAYQVRAIRVRPRAWRNW